MTDSISQPAEEEKTLVVERLRKMVRRYPEISGYHLQPDPTVVEGIVQGLARSVYAHGLPYCPCRDLTGDRVRDRDNICPCKWHRQEIASDGHCKCQLFVGNNYDPATAYLPEKSYEMITGVNSIRQRSVTIYANSWCAHSKRSRSLLTQLQIPFTNVDFEKDASAARQVEAWNNGYRSSPTIIIHQVLTEPTIVELERVFISSGSLILSLFVYMTSWCPDCRRTINWLRQNGISFQSLDIDKDSVAATRVSEWNQGNLSVPTLDVTQCVTEPSSDQLLAALDLNSKSF